MITEWKNGPHLLTYGRPVTPSALVAGALAKDEPDGLPSPALRAICDDLLEASVPEKGKGCQCLAGRGLDGPGDLLPAPAG